MGGESYKFHLGYHRLFDVNHLNNTDTGLVILKSTKIHLGYLSVR